MTSLGGKPGYGQVPEMIFRFSLLIEDLRIGIVYVPRVTISHIKTPNDHTSDFMLYTLSYKLSGAIHLKWGRSKMGFRFWKIEMLFLQVKKTYRIGNFPSDFLS